MKNSLLKVRLVAHWAIAGAALSLGNWLTAYGQRKGLSSHPLQFGYRAQLKRGLNMIDAGEHPWQNAGQNQAA